MRLILPALVITSVAFIAILAIGDKPTPTKCNVDVAVWCPPPANAR